MDVSNQTNRHPAELLASQLGLEEAWKANGDKTGTAYVVDAETHAILDTLTESDDLESGGKKVDAGRAAKPVEFWYKIGYKSAKKSEKLSTYRRFLRKARNAPLCSR